MEIALPSGRYAYGRVLKDAAIAVYDAVSPIPGQPPVGSRDYQFVVGIYEDALKRLPVVAHDASTNPADEWPPPSSVTDVVTGEKSVYHHGEMRPAAPSEADGLEPAAVWEVDHIVDRIESAEK